MASRRRHSHMWLLQLVALLGLIFGSSVTQAQIEISLEELTAGAESGDPKYQFALAQAYLQGRGVPRDVNTAISWYRKAAGQHYAEAENDLGAIYGKGIGVAQDFAQSIKWYSLAAEHGSPTAQSALGSAYYFGIGVGKNLRESAKWFRMAADQGHADSQYNLGDMYRLGEGVNMSYVEAYKWWSLAAKSGNRLAPHNRDKMATLLTKSELAEAQKLVDAFTPKKAK